MVVENEKDRKRVKETDRQRQTERPFIKLHINRGALLA